MIIRQAAKTLFRTGNLSRGTGSRGCGAQRMLASSSKAPPPVRSSTQTKDVTQEAIEKSERLHAEVTEVRANFSITHQLCAIIFPINELIVFALAS